jgi:ubiquinone/menaquinone biosynthesis C-methylase UbiE
MRKARQIAMQVIPEAIEPMVRELACFIIDPQDYLSYQYQRDEMTPPRRLTRRIGGKRLKFKQINQKEDFQATGNYYLEYCIKKLGQLNLKPNDQVLEAGCGCGRLAIALTKYLESEGSYEGFDIDYEAINWCQKHITKKYPNFNFQRADIYNGEYNPKGKYKASEYKFPYENESFDFVLLFSVFTHMFPQDVENYISEIKRVLKKDGKCLITYYLLNEKSSKLTKDFNSRLDFNFKYNFGEYSSIDENVTESVIALDESFIRQLYDQYQLKIVEPIFYGSWCGRSTSNAICSGQDTILASSY